MDYFNQNRLFIGAIVVLVILNIATLATLWMIAGGQNSVPPPGSPQGFGPKDFIERELHLSNEQQVQFDCLREEHSQASRKILDRLRVAKKSFFDLVRTPDAAPEIVTKQLEEIGRLQSALDMTTFRHFQQIRTMCNDDQRTRFDTVMEEMLQMMGGPPPPHRGGPPQ